MDNEQCVTRHHVLLAGMVLEQWRYASCSAEFGVGGLGENWATLYSIRSEHEGQGHATTLLLAAKAAYEAEGREVWGSVALNDRMAALYTKVGIAVYAEEH